MWTRSAEHLRVGAAFAEEAQEEGKLFRVGAESELPGHLTRVDRTNRCDSI